MKYCSECGNAVSLLIPDDDDRHRHVCGSCDTVHYQNPRIVVVALPCHGERVLMCKRAIEPRYGLWTLPGGFMENDETTQEAAARETREEAGATIIVRDIYTLYNLPHINQVHIFYRAELPEPVFASGRESLETVLMSEHEIPWNELAFPAVEDTLRHYFADRKTGAFPTRVADVIPGTNNQRLIRHHK